MSINVKDVYKLAVYNSQLMYSVTKVIHIEIKVKY